MVVLATADIRAALSLPPEFEPIAVATSKSEHHLVVAQGAVRLRLCLRPVPNMCAECLIILHDECAAIRLASAARFERAARGDRLGPDRISTPSAYRRARLVMLLGIHDGLDEGASSRDLAFGLIFARNRPLAGATWKSSDERRHTLRLIAEARRMVDGGYRALLRHS